MSYISDAPSSAWQTLSLDDLRHASRDEIQNSARCACQTAYLGDHTALCRVLARYLMYVDTRDTGLSPHLLLNGYWETWVTQAVARHVQPGMRVLDVGANVGYFSLLLADLVGIDGKVHAIEPNPAPFALLKRNLALNGFSDRSTALEVACDERDRDRVLLHVPVHDPGLASIVSGMFDDHSNLALESVECRAVRLDTILAHEDRVDFIKIDAEGAEPMIWNGMGETLRRFADLTVAMEFTPSRYADAAGFLDRIQRDGFVLGFLNPDGGINHASIQDILAEYWVMLWLSRS